MQQTDTRDGTANGLSEEDAKFVDLLVDKILIFMEALVGYPLYPYQTPVARRICESLIIEDAAEITALFSRQCLDGDTVVFRRDGSAVRLREHEDAVCTGIKPTKRYVFVGGAEIVATDNHPILTAADGWRAIGTLRPGDAVSAIACPDASIPVTHRGSDGEELGWTPLVTVEDAGKREVFDIHVEGKGWLIANGLQVSNSGKSELVTNTVATLMILLPRLARIFPKRLGKFKQGLLVGIFAPVEEQADTIFGRLVDRLTSDRAQEILSDPEIDDVVSAKSTRVELKNCKSRALKMTANPRAKIESKTFHLIVIDESQDCDDHVVNKSIVPMATATAGTIVRTGTPNTSKGDFYRTIQHNKRLALTKGGKQNHFEADWREVVKHNPAYGKVVRKQMEKNGEEADEFRMAYLLHWVLERGMFTTSDRMDALGDVTMQELVKAYNRTPVVVGIDPARSMDSTVVTVVFVDWDRPDEFGFFHHRVLNWLELQGMDWEEQYFQIVNFLDPYALFAVAVDSQGVGDAVAQRLSILLRNKNCEVVPMRSNAPDQSSRWKHLMTLMDRGMVSWPAGARVRRLRTWKKFYQQMIDAEKQFKGANVLVAAPDEAGAHDDYVDSLALACALTADLTAPTVEVFTSPFYK